MSKGRSPSRLRLDAAFWCSVLASDRATDAWSIKLYAEDLARPAMRIAWAAYKKAGTRCAPPAELWAEAEAVLRSPGSVRW